MAWDQKEITAEQIAKTLADIVGAEVNVNITLAQQRLEG